jgi:hypothetical protein
MFDFQKNPSSRTRKKRYNIDIESMITIAKSNPDYLIEVKDMLKQKDWDVIGVLLAEHNPSYLKKYKKYISNWKRLEFLLSENNSDYLKKNKNTTGLFWLGIGDPRDIPKNPEDWEKIGISLAKNNPEEIEKFAEKFDDEAWNKIEKTLEKYNPSYIKKYFM